MSNNYGDPSRRNAFNYSHCEMLMSFRSLFALSFAYLSATRISVFVGSLGKLRSPVQISGATQLAFPRQELVWDEEGERIVWRVLLPSPTPTLCPPRLIQFAISFCLCEFPAQPSTPHPSHLATYSSGSFPPRRPLPLPPLWIFLQ